VASTSGGAEQIQAEIEATRVQLAATLDELADRVSPKKVAVRGAGRAQEVLSETFTRPAPTYDIVQLADVDADRDGDEPAGGARPIRWERVAPAGVAAVLVLALVIRRRLRG
jgi:hypothetical protein